MWTVMAPYLRRGIVSPGSIDECIAENIIHPKVEKSSKRSASEWFVGITYKCSPVLEAVYRVRVWVLSGQQNLKLFFPDIEYLRQLQGAKCYNLFHDRLYKKPVFDQSGGRLFHLWTDVLRAGSGNCPAIQAFLPDGIRTQLELAGCLWFPAWVS